MAARKKCRRECPLPASGEWPWPWPLRATVSTWSTIDGSRFSVRSQPRCPGSCVAGLELFAGQGLGDQWRSLGLHGHRQDRLALGMLDVARHTGDGAARAHPATSTSTAPSVSFRFPGLWFFVNGGLAGFSNWPGRKNCAGSEATISLALSMAPFMPLAGSVSTSSAPSAFSTCAVRGSSKRAWSASACSHARRQRRPGRYRCCRGGLDYGHARLEPAAAFGIPDHVRANAALDRVARVSPSILARMVTRSG